jgi:hypothetical protein
MLDWFRKRDEAKKELDKEKRKLDTAIQQYTKATKHAVVLSQTKVNVLKLAEEALETAKKNGED